MLWASKIKFVQDGGRILLDINDTDDWIEKNKTQLPINFFLIVTDSIDGAKGKFVTGEVTYPGGLALPLALNIFFNLSWTLTVIGVTSGTEAERVSQIPP